MLMLKANAYGHGAAEVAKATCDIADSFGVVCVEEGIVLRNIGIKNDILVCACACDEIQKAVEFGLTVSLHEKAQAERLIDLVNLGLINARDLKLHLKTDSGMHRLGFCENEIDGVLSALRENGIQLEGVFSHLRELSFEQKERFERMANKVRAVYPNAVRHLASSHSLTAEEMRYDMVRVGLFAYERAMSVRSQVISARHIDAGEFVSYGNYISDRPMNLVTVFGGYADGMAGTKRVWIEGRECPVVGNVCMDMFVADCGECLPETGQEVLICDGGHIAEVASDRNTIDYCIYTAFNGRAERIYIHKKSDETGSEKNCKKKSCTNER